jgi:hypothetical protein
MSEIYSSYLSESTQKKENIYASWPKEKNTWGKNTAPASLVPAPLASAPLASAPRIPPPHVNRLNKPEIIIFKAGIVEESY